MSENIKECVSALNTESNNQLVYWFSRLTELVKPTILQHPTLTLEDYLDEKWDYIEQTIN